jgi:spore maturation protein CgeB
VNLVIFGLAISSAWGNGHATLWRGLCRAFSERGHAVTFFEKDLPYYAAHRDDPNPTGCRLRMYQAWDEVRREVDTILDEADVAMVTSYCPDGESAAQALFESRVSLRIFYDLDTGVTLTRVKSGERVPYLPHAGLSAFDLVLSYTGGRALEELQTVLGARRVAPLYGSVDPLAHRPILNPGLARADLSYLGTYAEDRQQRLEALFVEPARRRPTQRFVIAGSQYPADFPWTANTFYVRHMPPGDHPAFYSSSSMTLNVTRDAMAQFGYCPSARLFEAAACGTPILTDTWDGLEHFFEPGRELLVARSTDEALAAIDRPAADLTRMARAARERVLHEHTAEQRAREFEDIVRGGGPTMQCEARGG